MNCPEHHEQTREIQDVKAGLFDEIKPLVYKQTGQWRVFLWGFSLVAGAFMTAFIVILSFMYQNQRENREILIRTDKTFSNYMESHKIETSHGFKLIHKTVERVDDHEKRITDLEQR